jgi:hypothetical protein
MPELSEETFKQLPALYVRAHRTPGVSIEKGRLLRLELIERLTAIYSADPLAFPYTFEGFRRTVIDRGKVLPGTNCAICLTPS